MTMRNSGTAGTAAGLRARGVGALTLAALLLASCGGGGSGGGGGTVVLPTPSPTPTATGCSLRERQDWALATLREWYLFPETLPASPNPASFATVDDYIDSLTATARAQNRDRYFTYLTSIAEENAFYASGSSAGFGVRLATDSVARRLFIAEAFEGAPALAAGIDRGTEILAIGTSEATLRTVTDIFASEGSAGITNALGPSTAGTTRVLRISDPVGGVRNVTVTKADYDITPVSSRYGARIIDTGTKRIGYINLRTFISTADAQLRTAFANMRAQGITEFVIDLRYNGGGLVSTANLFGDLLGGNRSSADIFSQTRFRPEKSSNDEVHRFTASASSVSPVRIAFIGTGSTASASELVINGMIPFLGSNMALVGGNTYGKPVGQIAVDRSACDDRLRVVAFSTGNATNNTAYYTGLAGSVGTTCRAGDDVAFPLGDPREASVAQAIAFLNGQSCTAIGAVGGATANSSGNGPTPSAGDGLVERTLSPDLLSPERPSTAQREVPGLF